MLHFYVGELTESVTAFWQLLDIRLLNRIRNRVCIFPASSKALVELSPFDFIVRNTLCECAVEIIQYMLPRAMSVVPCVSPLP